ncbi:hydroxyethylthiazole kinase [Roseibium sp.]|uniref:hydroxyethylthiazole kinase n=1 Tax=Roseibium sp. TaxID=1936156 RepID=UPI003A981156
MTARPDAFSPDVAVSVLSRLRERAPRVHCITNAVAQSFTANVLLALGAIPSMTIAPEEVATFAASADALLVNLGTLDERRRQAIPAALEAARAAGKPIVLDPVFVNRSPVRCAYADQLLSDPPTLLRANREEVESLFPGEEPARAARTGGFTLAMTGSEDLICGANATLRLANGHPLLSRVTATGCAGGAVMAAFLSIEPDPVIASAVALSVFNIAGEIAAERARGPGSLVPELLDALYGVDETALKSRLKFVDLNLGGS